MEWRTMQMHEKVVRWQNGEYDTGRLCDECHKLDCRYPVHGKLTPEGDGYKEIVTRVKYWDWCNSYAEKDKSGHVIEPRLANPDSNGRDPNANALN